MRRIFYVICEKKNIHEIEKIMSELKELEKKYRDKVVRRNARL